MKSSHSKKEIEKLVTGTLAGIGKMEPILDDPEGLTDDIMSAIKDVNNSKPPEGVEKPGKSATLTIFLRLLAAASVCLFLVFGYEEYVFMDKISTLEKQNAAISHSSQYQAAFQLKKAMSILATDPEILNQYKDVKSRKLYYSTFSPLHAILKQIDSTYHIKK